ncbi:hypothetical protein G6F43_007076 [Rhizopus delemar]|nr:hypothetical protein G6F43_007076 [Rhizopus delemar]
MSVSINNNKDQQIAAVLVVGFHHAFGPIVEFCTPSPPQQKEQETLGKLELPEEWSFLPFLALPDGAHQKDEDFAYFHLPPVKGWSTAAETTLFGISYFYLKKDLLVKTPDVTRVIVQKAVVVLAKQPIFGPLKEKLAMTTAAWFNQRDFTNLGLLDNLYEDLNRSFCGQIEDSTLYMGTSLRELVYKFKSKTLMLLKLLLLEKRDSGSPDLDTIQLTMAGGLSDGTKESLLKYAGLPLHLFGKGSFFQPYLPLQQIDMLSSDQTTSYVAGTTNQIFFHQKSDTKIDVLVNVETGTIEFYDQRLIPVVSHTIADRKWMEGIVKVVYDGWNEDGHVYDGSDDYLRARFEGYILSLLSSVKHAQAHHQLDDMLYINREQVIEEEEEHNYLSDYGMKWLKNWIKTDNFKKWNEYTDYEIYAIVDPGHPGMGNISIIDLQNTLSNRLRDLQLKQNLAPIKNTLSKAMSGSAKVMSRGSTKFMKGMDSFLNDNDTSEGPSTQQVGKLFSNFSSFWSKKAKEFSKVMEEAVNPSDVEHKRTSRVISTRTSDDDSGSAFVNVDYPNSTKENEEKIMDI